MASTKYLALLAAFLALPGCDLNSAKNPVASFAHGPSTYQNARKLHAVVEVPAPGSFVVGSLNTSLDETIGVAGVLDPTVDALGIDRAWVHIPTGAATYEPGYSLTAAAYSNDFADTTSTLLPGTPFEVRWHTVAVQADGTGFSYFDPCDVSFGGTWHHFTNSDRNVALNEQGAQLVVNQDTNGLNCLVLSLPGGAVYMVGGVRP